MLVSDPDSGDIVVNAVFEDQADDGANYLKSLRVSIVRLIS